MQVGQQVTINWPDHSYHGLSGKILRISGVMAEIEVNLPPDRRTHNGMICWMFLLSYLV